MDVGLLSYSWFHEKGLIVQAVEDSGKEHLGESKILGLGRIAFGIQGFIPALLVCIILDQFLPIQARFIYLAIYGLGATAGVILKIIDAWKNGVRLQRI